MLSISISRIIDCAMARTALRSAVGPSPECKILSRDNMPALRRVVRDVLATAFMRINNVLLATNIATFDPAADDIVTIELNVEPVIEHTLLPLLESLATSGLLAVVYGQTGFASSDEADARKSLDQLAAVASLTTMPQRIQRSA